MNPFSISQIAKLAEAKLETGDGKISIERISTDSRTIKKGELFVALRGENFDGHKFVEDVAKKTPPARLSISSGKVESVRCADRTPKGGVPTSSRSFAPKTPCSPIKVSPPTIENHFRSKFSRSLAATARPAQRILLHQSSGENFSVTKTQGNFNNHVGLPRTILEATSQDEVAVWEIGMNHPGEVAPRSPESPRQMRRSSPTSASRTLNSWASREAIAQEKGALAEAVGTEGTVIFNADDPFSEGIAKRTGARFVLPASITGVLRATKSNKIPTASEFTILEGAPSLPSPIVRPGFAHGAKRVARSRRRARFRRSAGRMRARTRDRAADQSAFANQRDQRGAISR